MSEGKTRRENNQKGIRDQVFSLETTSRMRMSGRRVLQESEKERQESRRQRSPSPRYSGGKKEFEAAAQFFSSLLSSHNTYAVIERKRPIVNDYDGRSSVSLSQQKKGITRSRE